MIDKASLKIKKMLAKKEIWKMQIWSKRTKKDKTIFLDSLKKSSKKPSQESKTQT